jgi:predicted SprT family Zn-dependent metalloprotease
MRELGRAHLGRPLQDLGWSFSFDRARRRLGQCLWKRGDRSVKTISLSRALAAREGWTLMEDVARHEIAHALDYETRGRSAHDRTWKTWARRCGADPTRCYEGELADDPSSPYVGRCPTTGCDYARPFYRAVRSAYYCPRCEEASGRERSFLRVTDRRSGRVLHEGGAEPTRPTRLKRPPKYLGRCPRCGTARPFARRPKRRYACTSCCQELAGGRFDPRFELAIHQRR